VNRTTRTTKNTLYMCTITAASFMLQGSETCCLNEDMDRIWEAEMKFEATWLFLEQVTGLHINTLQNLCLLQN
jgi:hypothetical protein